MEKDTAQPANTIFYNIVLMYNLDYPMLQAIAKKAEVDESVMEAMVTCVAIHRVDAEKILHAFSEHTGKTWNFANVKVALLPTFKDLHTTHHLDLAVISTHAGVPFAVLDMMLENAPVHIRDARLALQMVSHATRQQYTLDNVDVQLTDGVHHD